MYNYQAVSRTRNLLEKYLWKADINKPTYNHLKPETAISPKDVWEQKYHVSCNELQVLQQLKSPLMRGCTQYTQFPSISPLNLKTSYTCI